MILRILFLLLGLGAVTLLAAQPDSGPLNAQPGRCYAKCYMPDQYVMEPEQVALDIQTPVLYPAVLEDGSIRLTVKEESKRYVVTEPVYETEELKVTIRDAYKKLTLKGSKSDLKRYRVAPARFDTVTQTAISRLATRYYIAEEAEYESVLDTYDLEPAYKNIKLLKPKYDTIIEQLEIRPVRQEWVRRQGDFNCLGTNPDNCYVWCLIERPAKIETLVRIRNLGCDGSGQPHSGCTVEETVPAKTATIPVQRVKKPAAIRTAYKPEEAQNLTRYILKQDAYVYKVGNEETAVDPKTLELNVQEETVPAEYIMFTTHKEIQPASYREETAQPGEYKTVNVKVLKQDAEVKYEHPKTFTPTFRRRLLREGGFTEWREVICGEQVTGFTIREIQQALKKLGYYTGPVNDKLTPETQKALSKFRQDRGLPQIDALDVETLNALKVSY